MRHWLLAAVTLLALAGCAAGPGADVRSGSAHVVIDNPKQGQVLTVRSVGVAVRLDGVNQYRLHYYLDSADSGEGDTSMTFTNMSPGNHHVEVEVFKADGSAYNPRLRAAVDFVIQ